MPEFLLFASLLTSHFRVSPQSGLDERLSQNVDSGIRIAVEVDTNQPPSVLLRRSDRRFSMVVIKSAND